MGDVIDDTLAILRDCQLDDPAVRDFLTAVVDLYRKAEDDDGPPFENFRRLMWAARDEQDTFRRAVDPFLEYAEYNGGNEVARRLDVEGVETLVRWYGEVPDEAGEEDEGYDENEWLAFLAEYTELSGWAGEEESWPEYKDFLLYYADERGFTNPTTALLEYADDTSDKVAFLESYGITIGATVDEAEDAYDPAEWNAFLVEYTERSGWTGEDEAWPAYRDYLLYYAEDLGFTSPTTSFLDAAENEDDKPAFFEQYGITLGYGEDVLDAWYPFLAEHGTEWNGQDSTWPRFRRSFLEAAATQGLTSVATEFLNYAEGEPDKVAFLAQYGVIIGEEETEAAAEEADLDNWYEFLAGYEADWDGRESTWPRFRQSFLDAATEQGLTEVAVGLLDYAEGETDKVAFLAQYGVNLTPAAAAEDTDTVAAARQTAERVATASPLIADEHVALVAESFAELVAELPEAADLSEAQLRQLMEEVAAEHLAPQPTERSA